MTETVYDNFNHGIDQQDGKMIARVAVEQAKAAIVGNAPANLPSPPAQITATNQQHPFIWGLDSWNDPTAVYTKRTL